MLQVSGVIDALANLCDYAKSLQMVGLEVSFPYYFLRCFIIMSFQFNENLIFSLFANAVHASISGSRNTKLEQSSSYGGKSSDQSVI